jgi:hypothetical protein
MIESIDDIFDKNEKAKFSLLYLGGWACRRCMERE